MSRVMRRTVTVLIVGAGVAGVFLLSHLSRATSAHQADDQEEMCRMIEEGGEEEYPGQLADCFKKLSQMRAAERGRDASQARTLDSVHLSP